MKISRGLLYLSIASLTLAFSVFFIKYVDTKKVRQREANASANNLKVATDPQNQEFLGSIVAGFPENFPVYPGAVLIGSSINNPVRLPDTSYTVKWHLTPGTPVADIILWYKSELESIDWQVEDPDLWVGITEQAVQILTNKITNRQTTVKFV